MAIRKILKWIAAVIIFLGIFKVDYISDNTANDPVKWALLIAGGEGLTDSFAFEGDISRTFDLLKAGGLKEENIVVFLYDKAETHEDNPFRGKIRPGAAKDYYAGLKKDYTGDDVTSTNIFSVLTGSAWAVDYRKVISASSRDTVFVVISAHGTEESIVIDQHEALDKRELMEAILYLKRERKFGSLLLYASSCHGSCVIEDIIFPEHSKIYVITSTSCLQRAVARNCSRYDHPTGKIVRICTSTDFHNTWLKQSHVSNRKIVNVHQQFLEIRIELARPVIGHVIGGDGRKEAYFSTASKFGDMSVQTEKLEKFQGYDPRWIERSYG